MDSMRCDWHGRGTEQDQKQWGQKWGIQEYLTLRQNPDETKENPKRNLSTLIILNSKGVTFRKVN